MAAALPAWDFYWLLRAQVGQRLKRYHMRVLALLRLRRQRREAPRDAVLEGPGHPLLGSSFHDFESGRPQTLRAVDAALFMEWLQKPKCEYVAEPGLSFAPMTACEVVCVYKSIP